MAILTKWQSWSYHQWLVVAGLVYLGVIVNLAIWNFPKSQFFKEIFTEEDVRLIFWVCVFWVCAIIIVFYLNIHYILLKNYKNIIIISNALLIIISVLFTLICYEYGISYVNQPKNDDKLFYSGGLILCLLASSIILVFLSVNYKWPEPENHGANAAFLIVTAFLFALLFSFPQLAIDKKDFATCVPGLLPHLQSDLSTTEKLIKWEHQKAVNEITERTKMDDTWYHNKFLLVGGLFGAILVYSATFVSKSRNKNGALADNLTNHIADMFKTTLPSSVLGMACVVSIGIDLHMRSNAIVTHHLGLWITHCVEGILNLHPDIFTGWENFLRIDKPDGRGMHRDFFFGIFAAAHFYLISVYLYVVYLSCVFFYFSPGLERGSDAQDLGASQEKKEQKLRGQFRFILFIFSLVHVTFLLFVTGGNFIPSILTIEFALWPTRSFSGPTAVVLPLALCFLVSGLAFIRLFTLYKSQLHRDR